MSKRIFLSKALESIATSYTKRNKRCFEQCIQYLLTGTKELFNKKLKKQKDIMSPIEPVPPEIGKKIPFLAPGLSEADESSEEESSHPFNVLKARNIFNNKSVLNQNVTLGFDRCIPFPRLCGGTFSPSGMINLSSHLLYLGKLTCFFSPIQHPPKSSATTPTKNKKQASILPRAYAEHPRDFQLYENFKNFSMISKGRKASLDFSLSSLKKATSHARVTLTNHSPPEIPTMGKQFMGSLLGDEASDVSADDVVLSLLPSTWPDS